MIGMDDQEKLSETLEIIHMNKLRPINFAITISLV